MRSRFFRSGLFFIIFICPALNSLRGAELEPKVLAFYYPWYRTRAFSGEWDHWNLEGSNPDQMDSEGRREITTAHYPSAGVYDSTDPDTIRRHLAESEKAGLDGWIVSWWGRGYQPDSVPAILDTIAKTGSDLKITIYYEMVPGCQGYTCRNRKSEERVSGVLSDLDFIREHYSSHPAFLKVGDRPVIFIYTRAMLQALSEWPEIIEQSRKKQDWFFSGDCITTFTPAMAGKGFDQAHFYNPVVELNIFSAGLIPYSDFVRGLHSSGKSAALTVIPGYDERRIPSRTLRIHQDRNSGKLYQTLWDKAIKAEPDWVLLTSFNEWHEGSEIEPSREFQDQYLDLTAEFSQKFKLGRKKDSVVKF